ncbi:MAG TPA: hypothetical protein ENL27_01170 [Candidatus Parcubacteria bacterium]|nr:hypothetical protein [Candidatus Parcubacteria bacterium]
MKNIKKIIKKRWKGIVIILTFPIVSFGLITPGLAESLIYGKGFRLFENLSSAGTLNISINSDLGDSLIIEPGQTIEKSIVVKKEGTLPLKYNIIAEIDKDNCDPAIYNNLKAVLSYNYYINPSNGLAMVQSMKYAGLLKDLNLRERNPKDPDLKIPNNRKYLENDLYKENEHLYKLKISLPKDIKLSNGNVCNISILTNAWQTNFEDNSCGFTDSEKIESSVLSIESKRPIIKVFYPKKGDLIVGKNYRIIWHAFNLPETSKKFYVELYQPNIHPNIPLHIGTFNIEKTKTKYSYLWHIYPGFYINGNRKYYIRVRTDDGKVAGLSQGEVTIKEKKTKPSLPSPIRIVSPNGGENLKKGEKYQIQWMVNTLPENTYYYIDLISADQNKVIPIDKGVIGTVKNFQKISAHSYSYLKTYLWKVPEDLKTGEYKIRIRTKDNLIKDYSDDFFNIAPRQSQTRLFLVSPNRGAHTFQEIPFVPNNLLTEGNNYNVKIVWRGGSKSLSDIKEGKVALYLDKYYPLIGGGWFKTVGRIPYVRAEYDKSNKKSAVFWKAGLLSSSSCDFNAPAASKESCLNPKNLFLVAPGDYFVRIVDVKTGASRRSDIAISIVSPKIDVLTQENERMLFLLGKFYKIKFNQPIFTDFKSLGFTYTIKVLNRRNELVGYICPKPYLSQYGGGTIISPNNRDLYWRAGEIYANPCHPVLGRFNNKKVHIKPGMFRIVVQRKTNSAYGERIYEAKTPLFLLTRVLELKGANAPRPTPTPVISTPTPSPLPAMPTDAQQPTPSPSSTPTPSPLPAMPTDGNCSIPVSPFLTPKPSPETVNPIM